MVWIVGLKNILDLVTGFFRGWRLLPKLTEDFVESLVAGWKYGRVPRATGSEKRFNDAWEVAFRVTFFDEAIVDRIAERGRFVARVNEIDRVTA